MRSAERRVRSRNVRPPRCRPVEHVLRQVRGPTEPGRLVTPPRFHQRHDRDRGRRRPAVHQDGQSVLELEPYNVNVNAIAPGFIDAGMSAPFFENESVRKKRADGVPLGRLGTAEDVASPADGIAYGNVLNWQYTVNLKVDDTTWKIKFDDWMFIVTDQILINKAKMSKFGLTVGEVTNDFFNVYLIPETLKITTFGSLRIGQKVNLIN